MLLLERQQSHWLFFMIAFINSPLLERPKFLLEFLRAGLWKSERWKRKTMFKKHISATGWVGTTSGIFMYSQCRGHYFKKQKLNFSNFAVRLGLIRHRALALLMTAVAHLLRKSVYSVCLIRPVLIIMVWKHCRSMAHNLQSVAAEKKNCK